LRLKVIPEEVAVDGRLDQARNPHDPVGVALFGAEAVDPVEQVQRAVAAEGEDVVRGQGVDETTSLAGLYSSKPRRDRKQVRENE